VSLVSYNELCEFVERGIITGVKVEDINGTSIDVHLSNVILREAVADKIIRLRDKEPLETVALDITDSYFDADPGQFFLAATREKFYLPSDITAEFRLNSSGARSGLNHALAVWCDPWWTDSALTLELKNWTQFHTIRLDDGVRIGQMIFHKSEPVPRDKGYLVRGRYNGDHGVQGVKS